MKLSGEVKLLLGIAIGILITLSLLFYYRKTLYVEEFHPTFSASDTTTNNKNELVQDIITLKIANNNIDEKIVSINKRFDDILIFGGIIITLLLAINVGVYVKAENEVKRHFEQHFDSYKKKIEDDAEQVKILLSQVKADAELAQKMKKEVKSNQQTAS
ncbi:MAG: hypothetical protein JST70_00755 [Bacteroidetes bacterium]|nr:hypothetical protein [Bacteroidota bacterium]